MESETSSRKCSSASLVSIASPRKQIRHYSSPFLFILISIKLVSIILALSGFVCTHKIQAEEECLSSNVLCYECDSRYDPNCADPFDFSNSATLDPQPASQSTNPRLSPMNNETSTVVLETNKQTGFLSSTNEQGIITATNETSSTTIPHHRQPKKLPAVAVCHGCCVKITSKTIDGAVFVKRTCTTNLQINYFMVGLVCMKESGDRGKMCFCETDYCNGKPSILSPTTSNHLILLAFSILQYLVFSSSLSISSYAIL